MAGWAGWLPGLCRCVCLLCLCVSVSVCLLLRACVLGWLGWPRLRSFLISGGFSPLPKCPDLVASKEELKSLFPRPQSPPGRSMGSKAHDERTETDAADGADRPRRKREARGLRRSLGPCCGCTRCDPDQTAGCDDDGQNKVKAGGHFAWSQAAARIENDGTEAMNRLDRWNERSSRRRTDEQAYFQYRVTMAPCRKFESSRHVAFG